MSDKNRDGKCLSSAYEDYVTIFKDKNALVVHGWAYSHKLKKMIKHAWIELSDGNVYEPCNRVMIDKDQQENLFRMRAIDKYNYWQIVKLSIETGFKGGSFQF